MNSKITLSEHALNWLKAFGLAVKAFGLVKGLLITSLAGTSIYGNYEAIESAFVPEEPPKVIVKPAPTTNHNAQFQQSIDSILAKLNKLDVELAQLKLKKDFHEWKAKVEKNRIDIDKMQKVVQ